MFNYPEARDFSVQYDELRRKISGILKEKGNKVPIVNSKIDKLILQLIRQKMSSDAYSQWKAEGIITFEGEKGVPVELETWENSISLYDPIRASQVVTIGYEADAQIRYFIAADIDRSKVTTLFGGRQYGDSFFLDIDHVSKLTDALNGFVPA